MQDSDPQPNHPPEPKIKQPPQPADKPSRMADSPPLPETSMPQQGTFSADPNPDPQPKDTYLPPEIGSPISELLEILEAILFASQKPVSVKEFQSIFKGAANSGHPLAPTLAKLKETDILDALTELACKIQKSTTIYQMREVASGWHLVTHAKFAPWLRQLYPENRPARLSAPALETLAIIAYRQPITKSDIEAIRGVAVDGVMQTLLDRGLVRIAGRAELPGRPLLYETTQFFLEHFGLRNLDELPNAAELRRVKLPSSEDSQKPESEETPDSLKASSQNPPTPPANNEHQNPPNPKAFTDQPTDPPLQDAIPQASANTDS